jgi:tRNA threonylcarbamoyladenosine biosynthesis protein TsaE
LKQLVIDISDMSTHQVAAKQLFEFAGNQNVFLFEAEMGNGKTTFIKSMCLVLGVSDTMSSPTYSIVNEYNAPHGKVFHFDLYRITDRNELFEFGFEDYLNDKNHIFIEWPMFSIPFLDSYVKINLKLENNKRYLYAEIFNTYD